MNKLSKLLSKFRTDERGVFAVIFSVLAIVLVATSGAVVDFVNIQNARHITQTSLDSTVLTLQSSIYTKTDTQIKALALTLVQERLSALNVNVEIETVTTDTSTGALFLGARINIPLSFLGLVGISEMNARVSAQAIRKMNSIEIAMVLDNSGSMGWQSRMSNLKIAARNATEIIFNGQATQQNVKMGIVPFTSFVNVGASNSNAPWIDVVGNSSIASDNFDNDDNETTPFNGPVNRLALYRQLRGVRWGGCVDARPHTATSNGYFLDTDDTPPDNLNPDTFFVPSFAPDTSDIAWHGNNYLSDDRGWQCSGANWALTSRESQERLCKYRGRTNVSGWTLGPNFDCPASAILPMTNVKRFVLRSIRGMRANGATNIHMGAIWGFRVLSPSEPFTEGDAYGDHTAKVMILMTDGENTANGRNNINGSIYYSPYGFPFNRRLGAVGWSETQLETEMNVRTVASCNSAKAAGITIYTIGLNPPNASTRAMLTSCASSASNAFFPRRPSELNAIFTQIANQLSALRLAQ